MSNDRDNELVKAIKTGDSEEWKRALRANTAETKSFTQAQWTGASGSGSPSTTSATTSTSASGPGSALPPPQNANLMPGGTEHTAGGKSSSASEVTLSDAARTIKAEDWAVFHKKPCVKDSFLVGIGSGFAVGSLRAIWRAPLMTACNWAVGSFCFGSFFMYQYCNFQRQAEKEGMKRAMEIIDRRAVERQQKEARLEKVRQMRRQKKEEEDQETYTNLRNNTKHQDDNGINSKSWSSAWKFW